MKLIAEITDETMGEKSVAMNNVTHRKAARGIVIKNNGQIAVFYKRKKNQYKLPGGGLEEGEIFEEAFIREVREEAGCIVDIVECLGTIEEQRSKNNFIQTSYVFVRKSNKR